MAIPIKSSLARSVQNFLVFLKMTDFLSLRGDVHFNRFKEPELKQLLLVKCRTSGVNQWTGSITIQVMVRWWS